jgi:hypothetical protein
MAACSFSSSRLCSRNLLQLRILGGIDPLVVPVDGLELLLKRRQSAVAIDGRTLEAILGFVEPDAVGHGLPLPGVSNRKPRRGGGFDT